MAMHAFTLCDKNYTARCLLMLDSLARVSRVNPKVTVLALDEEAWRVFQGRADQVLRIDDLGDAELLAVRASRSIGEFCWTCAPALSDFMLRRTAEGDFVAYLDADMYFFSDPAPLFAEMGPDKNILVQPHRFPPARLGWEATTGKFNVGLVGFRVSDEARACTARWRRQVLELCVKDPERGLCGDQTYLDEWPARYPGLQVMQDIGAGVAPWNVDSYRVAGTPGAPTVDGKPVIFYHYHQFRIVDCEAHSFLGVVYATGYDFPAEVRRLIYRDYVRTLKRQRLRLEQAGVVFKHEIVCDATSFHRGVRAGRIFPVFETVFARASFFLAFLTYVRERIAVKYLGGRRKAT